MQLPLPWQWEAARSYSLACAGIGESGDLCWQMLSKSEPHALRESLADSLARRDARPAPRGRLQREVPVLSLRGEWDDSVDMGEAMAFVSLFQGKGTRHMDLEGAGAAHVWHLHINIG